MLKRLMIVIIGLLLFIPTSAMATTVGLWLFDEGTDTTAHDSSGYGNHGTLVNGSTWSNDTPFTYTDNHSLSLDGVNDYVSVPFSSTNLNLNNSSFTAELWVYINDNNAIDISISQGDGTGKGRTWLGIDTDGEIYSWYGGTRFDAGFTITENAWHHIAFTYDNSNDLQKIFVNGNEEASRTKAGEDADGEYLFGVNKYYENNFNGLIDEIRFSDAALSADELGYNGSLIPEPATMILLGSLATGLFGMAAVRKKRG